MYFWSIFGFWSRPLVWSNGAHETYKAWPGIVSDCGRRKMRECKFDYTGTLDNFVIVSGPFFEGDLFISSIRLHNPQLNQ